MCRVATISRQSPDLVFDMYFHGVEDCEPGKYH